MVWVDSKYELYQLPKLTEVLRKWPEGAAMMMREQNPYFCCGAWSEFKVAMKQPRYLAQANKTMDCIRRQVLGPGQVGVRIRL